jgi:GGDEF domain-containing protein
MPDDLPLVYADYHRLVQVFTNILDNAVKYTPANARINIDARLVDAPFINGKPIAMPQLLPNPGFIEVSISDTGVGISPEDQKRIFDRFEQAGTSYGMGVGLGLSIARKIIENHHGVIWVESELGRGSKFAFILPVGRECCNIIDLIRAVDREIEAAKANGSSFSLILIHIEDFADILAKYGDSMTDEILTDIKRYIKHNTGAKEALACRSEDHGLVFCLYKSSKHAAADTQGQISAFIRQRKFPASAPAVRVSAETWIAAHPDDGITAVEVIDALAQNCMPPSNAQCKF